MSNRKIIIIFVCIIKLINAFEIFRLSPESISAGREHNIHKNTFFLCYFLFFFFFFYVLKLWGHIPWSIPGGLFHFYFYACPYLDKLIIFALSIKDFILGTILFTIWKTLMIRRTLPFSASDHHILNLSTTCPMSAVFTFFLCYLCQLCFNRDKWGLKETLFSKESRLGKTMTSPLLVRK